MNKVNIEVTENSYLKKKSQKNFHKTPETVQFPSVIKIYKQCNATCSIKKIKIGTIKYKETFKYILTNKRNINLSQNRNRRNSTKCLPSPSASVPTPLQRSQFQESIRHGSSPFQVASAPLQPCLLVYPSLPSDLFSPLVFTLFLQRPLLLVLHLLPPRIKGDSCFFFLFLL